VVTEPDSELYYLIKRFQSGDSHAGWLFVQDKKIQKIISGRLREYKRMFHWLPSEDLEDIECGLVPRIIEIIGNFKLPEQANDGRVISYFSLRLRGEADFLLKKVTDMKQMVDHEHGKTYLMMLSQTVEGMEDILPQEGEFANDLLSLIEDGRQGELLRKIFDSIPKDSNDRLWLECYLYRVRQMTWADIGEKIGYKQTDYTWLKENTARFVTRLKYSLTLMGERVNYRICGIYTDRGEVAIALFDSQDKKKDAIWSKTYQSYSDLDKVEAKLGDLFRQSDINYVLMNEVDVENPAYVIIMRYLSKREAFVETTAIEPFTRLLPSMPNHINGVVSSDIHRQAMLLAMIKRAWIDERRERGVADNQNQSGYDSVPPI